GEERRVAPRRIEHDLAVVRRADPRSGDREVAGRLDIDDEVIGRHLAHGPDLLAALFEKELIADLDVECHGVTLPRPLRLSACEDLGGAAAAAEHREHGEREPERARARRARRATPGVNVATGLGFRAAAGLARGA